MDGIKWNETTEIFRNYMGTGLIVIWFLIAIVYLFFSEHRKARRILFLYTPIIVLLLFLNPLFYTLFDILVGQEGYFRIGWLMPVAIVIAYAVVLVCGELKGKKALCFAVTSVLLIMVSGKLVYSSPLYGRAENIYHVPDSVVHICDAIMVPGREVMAVFPDEMLLYVRQYTPFVCMPYGREVIMGEESELHELMKGKVIDLEAVLPFIREMHCHFCILRADQEIKGDLEEYGWIQYGEVDGYVIYRDTATELFIPNM